MDFCLGTVQLGTRYGIQGNSRPSAAEAMGILSDALEQGICYFDTAAMYGEAEQILGEFAERFPSQAQRMHIISKLAPDAFQNNDYDKWREIALKNVRESLKKLKREKLEAFLFHNASHIFDPSAVEALDYVREMGLVDSIGVSIYTPQEAMRALEHPQISSIQVPYNMFDQRLDRCGFFAEARQKKVHVYARSSLLQGLAVMKPGELSTEMEFAFPYLEKFHLICGDFKISPLHAAIGFVAGNPGIGHIVFGVDSRRQLAQYAALRTQTIPIQMRDALADAFKYVDEKLVNPSMWGR